MQESSWYRRLLSALSHPLVDPADAPHFGARARDLGEIFRVGPEVHALGGVLRGEPLFAESGHLSGHVRQIALEPCDQALVALKRIDLRHSSRMGAIPRALIILSCPGILKGPLNSSFRFDLRFVRNPSRPVRPFSVSQSLRI